ncbi:MAG: cytochrome C oxidase subunit IV family protein [Verrucomicrobia bacterium]|nr:cytochrome C oxidase subunit IV family protein [Verrucomicrobiota bacterium]
MDHSDEVPSPGLMEAPPDPHAAQHVAAHVRTYLIVGATLLAFTVITVALSYVDFGLIFSHLFRTNLSEAQGRKANVAVAMLVAAFKAGLVAAIFMHLSAEKRLIYRILYFTVFFVLGLFWLTYLAWYNPIVR